METIDSILRWFVEPPAAMTAGDACARAAAVTVYSVALMRVAHRRLLGRNSALDIVVLMTLASVLGRGVTGTASLANTFSAGLAVVGCHYGLAWAAFRFPRLERALHGRASVVVRDGSPERRAMCDAHITLDDLHEGLRKHGVERLEAVKTVTLERCGELSVVERE